MKVARIVLGLCLLLAAVGSTLAQKVTMDYDKSANFSQYKTYTWGKGTPAKSPLMDQRIVNAIDGQLAAKGLRKVDAGESPQLIVVYHGALTQETQFNTFSTGFGPGWGYGWGGSGMSTTTEEKIPVGQLLVDIGEVHSKKLVWRGQSSGTVNTKPEKAEGQINKAVEKMFKKYPPPGK